MNLFHMYQVFSSLQGHLYLFMHFFFTLMGQFFLGHPIRKQVAKEKVKQRWKREETLCDFLKYNEPPPLPVSSDEGCRR